MALPVSVQKAADYADALEQQMAGQVEPAQPVAEETQPAAVETEPAGQEAAPEQSQPEDEFAKLRNKYSSLRGKYDAEVPRLHSQNKELETRIQQLMEENKTLRGEIASSESKTSYLTDKDTEVFGEDMVDLTRRAAREESAKFAQKAAEMQAQIEQLKQQVGTVSSESGAARQDQFYSALTQEFPDWGVQNSDKGFLEWLDLPDPVYGFPRKVALQGAYERLDAHTVANIFREYRNQSAKANPLARQVAPAHSRGVASAAEPKKTWTSAEIHDFYEAWRRGDVSEDKARLIEQEINDAVASGRVIA
jgi:predicted  nucleic acid-binding Zn-ribbon protein